MSASSKPSWRQKNVAAKSPARSKSKRAAPDWSERRPGPQWEGKAARIAALVVLALGVPALVTAWVWLFPDRQPTPMLVASISGYDAPVPPNAFAAEDAARFLAAYADYDNVRPTFSSPPRTSTELLHQIEDYLNRARPGGPDKNVVLIYLSAHGVVNDQGEPCLLLPGHDPLVAATWLPMAKVLEALAQPSASKPYTTVLLLDAHRIDDAWRMGIVANTFSFALDKLLASSPPRNSVILTAASELQSAVAAPEISGTPFGYYAALGLRGEADREGDRDKIVTFDELGQYVTRHVNAWAIRYRGVRQEPRMYGDTDNLQLADVAGSAKMPTAPWKAPVNSQEFKDIFKRVGKLEGSRVFATHPLEWARIQFLLERLDAESVAGKAYAGAARAGALSDLRETLADLEAQQPWPYGVKPLTLAMRSLAGAAPSDNSLEIVWKAWLKEPAKSKVPADYDGVAAFVWEQLCEGAARITGDDLAKHLQFCDDQTASPPAVDFTETALLRLLSSRVDWQSPSLAQGIPRRLLEARRQSEQIAASGDPRQHYVIAPRLRAVDQNLALAFDQVLVGSDESVLAADQRLNALVGAGADSYEQVRDLADSVHHALNVRDVALASALPLNQWWTRRARWDLEYRDARTTVRSLVEDALDLSQLLDQIMVQPPDSTSDSDVDRLKTLSARLESTVTGLLERYAQRVADVTIEEGGSQTQTAIEIPELLRSTVRFDEGRVRLHQQWLQGLSRPAELTRQQSDQAATSPKDDDLDYLRWLAAEGARPLSDFLRSDRYGLSDSDAVKRFATTVIDANSSQDSVVVALAGLGGRIRGTLRDARATCQQLCNESSSMLVEQPANKARLGFSRADALSRFLAPIAGESLRVRGDEASAEEGPADLLRRLDAQAWLVWHGDRLIDDCWGPVRGGDSATPYFQTAAAQAADDAERLFPSATAGVNALRRRLQTQQQLMADWEPLSAKDLEVSEDGDSFVSHEVSLQAEPKMRPGETAVYLTDDEGELFETYTSTSLPVRRVGVNPLEAAELGGVQLDPEQLAGVSVLKANVLFRGHVRSKVFSIGRGVQVTWQRPAPSAASVVVRGDSKQISQIVFVVDCSWSMQEQKRNKLAAGVEKLRIILDQLVNREDKFSVALIFYGRRAGWKSETSSEIKWRDKATYNGYPGLDVEVALPLTPLRKQVVQDINAKLGDAKPYGETPLHLALIEALKEFDLGAPGPCHLIAITDGVNDVAKDQPFEKTPYTAVINEMAKVAPWVKLDIIEFGGKLNFKDPKEAEKWETGRKELEAIVNAARPRGSFRKVQDADALAKDLQDSLRLDRYQLQLLRGGQPVAATEWQDLGQASRLEPSESAREYQIVLQTHRDAAQPRVQIEGGEALELVYRRPPENRLLHPIYEGDDRRGSPQTVDGALVASHMPRFQLADPVFRVSIQSGDEQRFSRRPDVIFAKVESIELGEPRAYYFFDREFEPGLPAPMLNLRSRNWTGSKFARVDLSFIVDAKDLQAPWSAIPPLGSTRLKAHSAVLDVKSEIAGERYQVVVREQHSGEGRDYPLHIQLDPPPDSASRTFFESNRSARHVFRYSSQPSKPMLRILTREEIEAAGAAVTFDRVELPRR